MEIIETVPLKKIFVLTDYTELKKTNPLTECNAVFVNHFNRTFWFTNKTVASHTMLVAKSKI